MKKKNITDNLKLLTILVSIFLLHCSDNLLKDNLYVEKVIEDFLEHSDKKEVSRSYIEQQLYDIYDDTRTRGRAIHIGDGIFLTANHVVSNITNGAIILQTKRNNVNSNPYGKYEVLASNAITDTAIIKIPITKAIGKATFRLYEKILQKKDNVSQLIYYSKYKKAPSKNKRFEMKYEGLNYYDNIMPQPNLGRFVFLPGSLMFEKQGTIWPFNEDYFKALKISTEQVPIAKENQYFTSIPVFPGESGSGVFYREGEYEAAKYSLCCITIIAWATSHLIQTPGHPLGYKTMQQSSDFVIRNDVIRKFLKDFLVKWKSNRLKFQQQKKTKPKL